MDLQRHRAAEAAAQRATASRSCCATTTGCRSTSRRTTPSGATPSAPTSTTATTARRTTASPARSSTPASSTTTTGRWCTPAFPDHQHRRDRHQGEHAQRQRRHPKLPGRLARDHEHALVPRPHVRATPSQNVYKGNAAMYNIYSSVDRGNEAINDGVNLRLPSGTAKDWGNLEYDVNLMPRRQGLGRQRPARVGHLRLRRLPRRPRDGQPGLQAVLQGRAAQVPLPHPQRPVARFFKLALSDGKSFTQIGNDGNLLPNRCR